ncbi:acetyl esterase/lipase [Williamsia muralis]|nr:acetyl esterase/lipase [Williamsia marianensis]
MTLTNGTIDGDTQQVQQNTSLLGPVLQPSRRSQALVKAASTVLRPLAEVIPDNRAGVAFTRAVVAASMMAGDSPQGVSVARVHNGGVVGEWVRPRQIRGQQVILYLHGSGYAICSTRTHRALVSRLARYSRLPAFSVEYRLAPEHVYPAAADDVAAAYEWLMRQGYDASDIVIAGDSAGGHLALDLVAENERAGRPQPRAVVLFSPLLDLTLDLAARQERTRPDPIISAAAAKRLVSLYTAEQPADLPRLRLELDESKHLPPFMIQAGGFEMLRGDAEEMARMLRVAGADCHLQIWPGQLHVFQAFARLVPEARLALRDAATFITKTPVTQRRTVPANSTHRPVVRVGIDD